MGWVIAAAMAVVVMALLMLAGRLPRATWELTGAALLLGLAGYAWQGHPRLPGSPRTMAERAPPFNEDMIERRRGMAERFGPAAQWMVLSDGLARQGKKKEAANVLLSGLRQSPDDPNLWLGLANALVEHGDMLSPGADYAYRKAIALEPEAPAAAYFYGLALARSGDLAGAKAQWAPIADKAPPDSEVRAELLANIARIDAMLAGKAAPVR